MPRPIVLAFAAVLAAPLAGAWAQSASAGEAAGAQQPTAYLTWPGKSGVQARHAAPTGAVALPRQFFGGGDDMAAAPPPLDPRPVPGTQAATSSANTASNRARQNEILTADSASDGPVGGAESPN